MSRKWKGKRKVLSSFSAPKSKRMAIFKNINSSRYMGPNAPRVWKIRQGYSLHVSLRGDQEPGSAGWPLCQVLLKSFQQQCPLVEEHQSGVECTCPQCSTSAPTPSHHSLPVNSDISAARLQYRVWTLWPLLAMTKLEMRTSLPLILRFWSFDPLILQLWSFHPSIYYWWFAFLHSFTHLILRSKY